jgi:hypothetical protein
MSQQGKTDYANDDGPARSEEVMQVDDPLEHHRHEGTVIALPY